MKHIFKFLLDASQNGIKHDGKTYHTRSIFQQIKAATGRSLVLVGPGNWPSIFAICAGAHPKIVPNLGQGDVGVRDVLARTKMNATITSWIIMMKQLKRRRK